MERNQQPIEPTTSIRRDSQSGIGRIGGIIVTIGAGVLGAGPIADYLFNNDHFNKNLGAELVMGAAGLFIIWLGARGGRRRHG